MNKSGQITFYKIFLGLVVLSMCSVGLVSFMTELTNNYVPYGATPLSPNETEVYNKFNILSKLQDNTSSMLTSVENPGQEELSDTSFFILAPAATWDAIQTVFLLPGFILNLAVAATTTLQLPSWVLSGVNIIVITLISFLVLSAIIKWRLQ